MSQTSHDAKAVVRALDALTTGLVDALTNLTTQVKRAADYQQADFTLTPDAVDDAPTTTDDGPAEHCEHDGPHPGFTCGEVDQTRLFWEAQWARDAERTRQQAPAADEDAQRTARRNSAHNLLARLDRGGLLSPADCTLLRQHYDTEAREHDTARAVAAGNKRHVQVMYAELEQANEAARKALQQRQEMAEERYALQERAEKAERAADLLAGSHRRAEEYEQERNQLAAVLAEVLRQFTPETHPGRRCLQSGHVPVETVDRWRSVVQHDVERPWWKQVDEARAELAEAQAELKGVRNAAHLHRKQLLSTAELYAVIGPVDPDGAEQPNMEG